MRKTTVKSKPATKSNARKRTTTGGRNRTTVSRSRSSKPEITPDQGLRKLFMDGLKDIYWAEKALVKSLSKIMAQATTDELTETLTVHLEATKEHVNRLESVFASMDQKASAKKCEAMEGLIREAGEIMEENPEGVVRDAGIIAAAQKIEHYEIATYGTLCAFAKILGEEEALGLLRDTLEEEKEADEQLSSIAETKINIEASRKSWRDEEDEDFFE